MGYSPWVTKSWTPLSNGAHTRQKNWQCVHEEAGSQSRDVRGPLAFGCRLHELRVVSLVKWLLQSVDQKLWPGWWQRRNSGWSETGKVLRFEEIKNHCIKPISTNRYFFFCFHSLFMTVYLAMVFTLPRITDLFENLLKATYPCPHLWCWVPYAGVGHHGRHGTNSRVRGLPRASVRRPWAQNGTLRGLDPCPSPHTLGDTGILWMLLSHHPERQPLCYLKKITDSHWSNRLGKISGQRMT